MAGTNKSPKSGGSAGDAFGIIAVASAVIGLAKPVIDMIDEKRKERAEERKDWVTIPEMCSKSVSMKLDCAVDSLEKLNLQVVCSSVEFKNADVKYKDCFDLQVVKVNQKQKTKVEPGTLVILTYVNSEVIEKSQRLFDESESSKKKVALEKAEKRAEQKDRNKKLITNTLEKMSRKEDNN